jgi:hypothetical protein
VALNSPIHTAAGTAAPHMGEDGDHNSFERA